MTLPEWKAIPVRTRRSRKRLHNLIAAEFSLDTWIELPNSIKRSKKKLYNFIANELNISSFDELPVECRRSTRLRYNFIKENGEGSGSSGTLTVTTVNSEQTLLENCIVYASDGEYNGVIEFLGAMAEDPTIVLGMGVTDNTGECTIMTMSGEMSPVEPVITFEAGEHYIYALTETFLSYVGSVTINGDTTTTVTLEEMATNATVSVTCIDGDDAPVDSAVVMLMTENAQPSPENVVGMGMTGEDGTTLIYEFDDQGQPTQVVKEVPFGSYYLKASYSDGERDIAYGGDLTVGSAEVSTTITLT